MNDLSQIEPEMTFSTMFSVTLLTLIYKHLTRRRMPKARTFSPTDKQCLFELAVIEERAIVGN